MSQLDELIAEFCPNGVEYKTIDEIAVDIYRGSGIKRDQVTEEGIPCVRYGEIYTTYGVWFEECKSHTKLEYVKSPKYFEHGDILFAITGESVEDIAKCCAYIGNEKCLAGGDIVVLKHKEDPKYISYALSTVDAQRQKSSGKVKSKVVHSSVPSIKAIKLPVPPLEVQREIVHILDSFTLLTAELTAELTARKKQYEYYRDNILTFDTTIKHVRLGDICSIITKGTTPKSYTKTGVSFVKTEAFDGAKIIPNKLSYVDEETHTTFLKRSMLEENDILITIAGATIGKCAIVPKEILPANTNQALAIIRLAKGNSPKYVMYLLQSDLMKRYMQKNIKGSAQPNLNLKQLNDFIIPLPPLNVQERLVRVLDNFEAICTDLNIGLPAEIEARQKQYEYYRDLLLTFAETGSTLKTDRQTDRQTELSAIKLIQYVFGYAMVSLDYIADFRNGKGHEKSIVADGKYIVVNSKFISTDGQVRKYSDDQICPLYVNDILMVMSDLPNGRALARCYLVDEDDKYTLNQRIGAFTVSRSDLVTTKYLYYILSRNPQLLRYDNGADQTNLRKADILNISIAVPTVKEQKKITEILDHFNTLCNDLSAGLPAEIEARQKQYEYYRDKLLSFKELPK